MFNFKLFQLAPTKQELVENSFWAISTQGDVFVAAFYERLFERHPNLKPFFANTEPSMMHVKMLKMLALIVENLRNPDKLVPALEALGKRHRLDYRVLAPHYMMVADSLLQALAELSGPGWTPNLERAWREAIEGIVEIMIYQA